MIKGVNNKDNSYSGFYEDKKKEKWSLKWKILDQPINYFLLILSINFYFLLLFQTFIIKISTTDIK